MKSSNKKLLACGMFLVAALGISAYARRVGTTAVQDTHFTLTLDEKATPASFDAQMSGGKVVSMMAVFPSGNRIALSQQSKPTCATSCPAGQHLSCWEDHDLQMSMCVCVSSTGRGGSAVVSLGKL